MSQSARKAGVLLGTGGTTDFSSPVLYADASQAIAEEAGATATEMLLGAWFYLSERAGLKEITLGRLDDRAYRDHLRIYLRRGQRVQQSW